MHDHSFNSGADASHLLSHVLHDLKPANANYCRTEVTRPWGIGMQFEEGVRFHFVAEGRCWVLIEGAAPELLEQFDVILLPHGTKHVIADDPVSAVTQLAQLGPEKLKNLSGIMMRVSEKWPS